MNGSKPANSLDHELKKVGQNTFIYSFGNIITKSVAFLLIPLYTQCLTGFEVGIIILLEVIEAFYNSAAPLGLINAIWRYFHGDSKEGNEKALISSHFMFLLAANLFLILILIIIAPWVSKIYLSDGSFTNLLRFYFLALFFGLSRVFILSLLRIREKAIQFIIIAFSDFLVLIGLTVWFVIGLDWGIEGVIYAKLITAILIFVFASTYIIGKFGVARHAKLVRRSLRYGMPLIFHGISLLMLTMSDRIFIKEFLSVEASGIYGISYKFGMIMNMVLVTPFVHAWQPLLFRLEGDPEQKTMYSRIALHFVQIATLAWLAISICSKYLVIWTTPEEYYAGIIIIPWIVLSYLLYGMQNIFKAGILLSDKTFSLTKYTLYSAMLNILLNFLLIPYWGIIGATIATVFSYFVMLILVYSLSQRHLRIDWRWGKMLPIILLGFVFCLASLIDLNDLLNNLLKDCSLLLILPLLMFWLKLVSFEEVTGFVLKLRGGWR